MLINAELKALSIGFGFRMPSFQTSIPRFSLYPSEANGVLASNVFAVASILGGGASLLSAGVKSIPSIAKSAEALDVFGIFGRGKGASTGTENTRLLNNPLKSLLDEAKPTPGVSHQLETVLDDGTKIIFRRDVGEHAHPIGRNYPDPVDHYNIEVHTPDPSRPGRIIREQNVHIILDNKLNPIDIILKNRYPSNPDLTDGLRW
jgi:hypothetical protein